MTIDIGKSDSDAKAILDAVRTASKISNGLPGTGDQPYAERLGNVVVELDGGASDGAVKTALK